MFNRLVAKLIDWLVAILIVCVLLWFFITQPIFPVQSAGGLPQPNQTNLKNHVINLRKLANSQQLMEDSLSTDSYIFSYLSRIGKPTKQSFAGMSGRYNNISLLIGSKAAKRIVIGVQYSPPKGNAKQPWNPSGIAALLETARVFGASKDKLPVAVELVAYATAGMVSNGTLDMGSFHHAKALKKKRVDLLLMLALRSVGYYRSDAYTQQYPFSFMRMLYPDTADFISLSSRLEDFRTIRSVKQSFSRVPEMLVESVSAPEIFPLVGGADHENYWVHNFSALQVSDLLEYRLPKRVSANKTRSLDYQKMSHLIQALYQTVLDSNNTEKDNEEGVMSGILEKITALFN